MPYLHNLDVTHIACRWQPVELYTCLGVVIGVRDAGVGRLCACQSLHICVILHHLERSDGDGRFGHFACLANHSQQIDAVPLYGDYNIYQHIS